MMKLLITWKEDTTDDFKWNKKKIINKFSKWGLRCVDINPKRTDVIGTNTESDFTRIWGCIHEELMFHRFFYDTIANCFWYDDGIREDIIETGMALAIKRGISLDE